MMKKVCILLVAWLVCSCGLNNQGPALKKSFQSDMGGVAVFLTASDQLPADVSFTIKELAIMGSTDWTILSTDSTVLGSKEIGNGQRLLGFFPVQPGEYGRIRLLVGEATMNGVSLPMASNDPQQRKELLFDVKLSVENGGRLCLLLDWRVKPSVREGVFAPVVVASPQSPALSRELLYAACAEIDTVFVIRMDTNHVVNCFGLRGNPNRVRMDAAGQVLYVMTSKARQITGLDVYGNRVLSRMNLTGMPSPQYWDLSPDGQWAFVSDPDGFLIQKLAVRSGSMDRQLSLRRKPGRILSFEMNEPGKPKRGLVAVAIPENRVVSLYDSDRMEMLTPETLSPVRGGAEAGINTGPGPEGMAYNKGILYICDSGSNTVTIFDLLHGKTLQRVPVGLKPREVLVGKNDRIYVSNAASGSLAVLVPGQYSPLKDVDVGGGWPSVMAKYGRRSQLYVAMEGIGGVSVMDLNSDQIIAQIPLPAPAVSLETFE